ncbi:DUF4404 family protein [Aquabacterium lacunae]|uniref:DUF4404 family protein n=1 Tax=Aquabacterium lacunae TaxID=2528630 RepID=A0A4Q9H4T0_9BURK|nr:DUF4404 family protein [Aquabacterium lacunae]TBO33975.1 DUF4404 family protein [Aquabacterium lacunae]
MHTTELKALLRRVQHELDQMPDVDPSLQGQLSALEESIHSALRRVTPLDAEDALHDPALAIEARLEADHPMLVHSMRQMMDSLGKMGI